jgi:hypothetical protein
MALIVSNRLGGNEPITSLSWKEWNCARPSSSISPPRTNLAEVTRNTTAAAVEQAELKHAVVIHGLKYITGTVGVAAKLINDSLMMRAEDDERLRVLGYNRASCSNDGEALTAQ